MSVFLDIFPVVTSQMSGMKAAMDRVCRGSLTDLTQAFFQDFPQISSIQWMQVPEANGTTVVTSFVFNGVDPTNLQMMNAIKSLEDFLTGIHFHLHCAYGVNVWVTVTPKRITAIPILQK